jgi:hypothetical protein
MPLTRPGCRECIKFITGLTSVSSQNIPHHWGLTLKHNVISIFVSFLLAVMMIWAQAETGKITGIVLDTTGAVIPSASVVLRNTDTGGHPNQRHIGPRFVYHHEHSAGEL